MVEVVSSVWAVVSYRTESETARDRVRTGDNDSATLSRWILVSCIQQDRGFKNEVCNTYCGQLNMAVFCEPRGKKNLTLIRCTTNFLSV